VLTRRSVLCGNIDIRAAGVNRTPAAGVAVSMGWIRLVVATLLCTGALTACTAEATTGPVITIRNSTFTGDLIVTAGAEVTVRNEDPVEHLLSGAGDEFTSATISPGGTGEFYAPITPGEYAISCSFHPEMTGTLVVVGPGASGPSGSAS
jgi:plastocyanin